MPNTNLLQAAPEKKYSESIGLGSSGVISSIVLLVIALAVWGGFTFYTADLNKKITDVDVETKSESVDLVGKDVDRIGDIQERIAKIKSNIAAKKNPQLILKEIERVIVQGVVVQKFSEKGSQLTITFQAKNFTEVSKQIVSFKKDEYFSDVVVSNLSRDKDGNIQFDIVMGIK